MVGPLPISGGSVGIGKALRASSSLPAVSRSETLERAASVAGGGIMDGSLPGRRGGGAGVEEGAPT